MSLLRVILLMLHLSHAPGSWIAAPLLIWTNRRDWFSSFSERTGEITIGDSSTVPIRGSGTLSIFRTSLDMRYFSIVLFVPALGFNLLSVSSLTKQGASVEFLADQVTIRDYASGATLASGQQDGGLYKFMALVSQTADDALWHARFRHLSYSTLQQTHKDGMIDGFTSHWCFYYSVSVLVFAASKRGFLFHRKLLTVHQKPFELVHSDLCGPMSTESLSGASYMMLIIDDFSRYIWASFLKSKDQAFTSFKDWRVEVEKQFEHKVKALRNDRGGEFLSKKFDRYLADHGIQRQLTTAHTPSQNGVAERKNRSVIEMDPNAHLSAFDASPPCDTSLYRQIVGSLIWLTHTRLDVAYSTGLLSSFSAKPLTSHLHAARRVLRYLNATPHRSILYGRGTTLVGILYGRGTTLVGHSDSNWAGNIDTRRLTTGYCFTLGSGTISWSSKKQPTVALSATEAEYRAACSAATEAIWLRRLLQELCAPQSSSTLIWCDN